MLQAAPIVRSAAGSVPSSLDATLFQFLGDIGGGNNGAGGSFKTGFRVADWDAVQDNQLQNGSFIPADYFNTTSPRGMVLSSACSTDEFRVSSANQNSPSFEFGNINPNYPGAFKNAFGTRLFSANVGACNITDVYFYIPGTKTPATVKSFGVYFTDVDSAFAAGILAYGVDGKPIGSSHNALPSNNGLSFIGVTFNAGERIARVRIFSGSAPLGDPDNPLDVVVMDNFYFSEPRAIGHQAGDFDGDGAADQAIFRPSTGAWYVFQSGSNTFTSVQFGSNGDIPVEADFDGDSRSDYAVFRPSTGAWYISQSSNNEFRAVQFGQSGDKPVPADYDKDGKADIAVWRGGNYFVLQSSNNQFKAVQWGAAGDIPVGSASQ